MIGRLAMALIGGTSVGAGLMYLFDPEQGKTHRKTIRRAAHQAYDTAAEMAGKVKAEKKVMDWRGRLAGGLQGAARRIAPKSKRDPMGLDAGRTYTAVALARHSRELHGEARESYARARDLYYDALIDLDLARARGRRLAQTAEPPVDYLTVSLVTAGLAALAGIGLWGKR